MPGPGACYAVRAQLQGLDGLKLSSNPAGGRYLLLQS